MPRRKRGAAFVLVLLGVAVATGAGAAERFDLVVASHVRVKAYVDPIAMAGGYLFSAGLIVNTGDLAISGTEITGADVAGSLMTGDIPWGVHAFWMHSSSGDVGPDVMPAEAIGYRDAVNDTLLTLLRPEETLRTTDPRTGWRFHGQVLCPQGYSGTCWYDVAVTLGDQSVSFPVQVDITPSSYEEQGLEIVEVLRLVSSSTVAALPTTWGALKSLYR